MPNVPLENIVKNNFEVRRIIFIEFLFCISIISIFFPLKIYPLFFSLSSLLFVFQVPVFKREKWMVFLLIYICYTILIFIFRSSHSVFFTSNVIKLVINFFFLISSITWISKRDNTNLIYWLEKSFFLIFFLTFLQIILYHAASGFIYLNDVGSSAEASTIYKRSLYFWGVDDKNMLGAKIGLLGYIYIITNIVLQNKFSISRIIFIFLLSFLSLSRTPIGVILIGLFFILFFTAKFYQRGILLSVCIIIAPFVLNRLIRIDNITNLNDGMGIRLIYWATFFENLNHISIFGNGFLSAGVFLEKYAYYYNGEPNLHNAFFNTYLDVGVIGLVCYVGFLYFFISYVIKKTHNRILCLACFITLLANMVILFTGYDNDVIVFIVITYLLCSYRQIDIRSIKFGL